MHVSRMSGATSLSKDAAVSRLTANSAIGRQRSITHVTIAPMKKALPGSAEVDQYLAAVPEPARTTLSKIRAMIRSAVPSETVEAIGYRMPTFRYKGALVGYA